MTDRRNGMALLEALLVLGVLALLSVLGMRALGLFLERIASRQVSHLEVSEIMGLGERIQRHYDQRRDHVLLLDPALVVEGRETDSGYNLESVSMATLAGEWLPAEWRLSRAGDAWQEQLFTFPESGPEEKSRTLNYSGRIIVDGDLNTASKLPGIQRWTFPDAASLRAQEGFAIYRFW